MKDVPFLEICYDDPFLMKCYDVPFLGKCYDDPILSHESVKHCITIYDIEFYPFKVIEKFSKPNVYVESSQGTKTFAMVLVKMMDDLPSYIKSYKYSTTEKHLNSKIDGSDSLIIVSGRITAVEAAVKKATSEAADETIAPVAADGSVDEGCFDDEEHCPVTIFAPKPPPPLSVEQQWTPLKPFKIYPRSIKVKTEKMMKFKVKYATSLFPVNMSISMVKTTRLLTGMMTLDMTRLMPELLPSTGYATMIPSSRSATMVPSWRSATRSSVTSSLAG